LDDSKPKPHPVIPTQAELSSLALESFGFSDDSGVALANLKAPRLALPGKIDISELEGLEREEI